MEKYWNTLTISAEVEQSKRWHIYKRVDVLFIRRFPNQRTTDGLKKKEEGQN